MSNAIANIKGLARYAIQTLGGGILSLGDDSAEMLRIPGGWRDFTGPLIAAKLAGVNDPSFDVFKGATRAYAFSPTKLNEAFLSWHINHEWRGASDIFPHVHWAPVDAGAGAVVWGLEYAYASVNGIYTGTTTLSVTSTAPGVAFKSTAAELGTISGSSLEIGGTFVARVFRDATNVADTYAGNAFLLQCDLHIQCNRLVTATKFGPYET